jgi:hypothetical protein
MANKGRATFAKRQKEIARQERAREKAAKRKERDETKLKLDRQAAEVDPDIAGIDLLDEEVAPPSAAPVAVKTPGR